MARFARRSMRISIIAALFLTLVAPQAGAADQGFSDRGEKLLLKAINEYRVKQGLGPVEKHTFMGKEARRHTNYISNHGKLSHDNFDERAARIEGDDGGIDADKICENVASAQGYDSPGPVAKLIFTSWKKAASKRACILDTDFTKQSAGIGVKLVGDTWYATFLNAHDTTP